MFLYMGGGAALADYYRMKRAALLTECAAACGELSRLGTERLGTPGGDREALALALRLAEDCRGLCSLGAALMTRESGLTDCLLAACAEACRRCAGACASLSDEEIAARCALACRQADEACHRAAAVLAA